MTPETLLSRFGSKVAIAEAANCSAPAVNIWFREGKVPPLKQIRFYFKYRIPLDEEVREEACIPRRRTKAA